VRRLLRDGVYARSRLVYVKRVAAATLLQRRYRGHLTRRVMGEVRAVARKQVLMAIRIQVRTTTTTTTTTTTPIPPNTNTGRQAGRHSHTARWLGVE
jgi:hypothetical protein